eukprot:TRINITY_DN4345_c0_g2_i5.p1 TRINITY_DN4345_c0_g2~~TRINITY_DN4345_c0_g2_i5.p1  ORF type:complete len:377 (+),score=119.27 TRINITY_DN4345_c0_g2_i5:593-1723(+)
MVDHDLFNFGFQLPYPECGRGKLSTDETNLPMLVWGSSEEFIAMARIFAAHDKSKTVLINGSPHLSDMVMAREFYRDRFTIVPPITTTAHIYHRSISELLTLLTNENPGDPLIHRSRYVVMNRVLCFQLMSHTLLQAHTVPRRGPAMADFSFSLLSFANRLRSCSLLPWTVPEAMPIITPRSFHIFALPSSPMIPFINDYLKYEKEARSDLFPPWLAGFIPSDGAKLSFAIFFRRLELFLLEKESMNPATDNRISREVLQLLGGGNSEQHIEAETLHALLKNDDVFMFPVNMPGMALHILEYEFGFELEEEWVKDIVVAAQKQREVLQQLEQQIDPNLRALVEARSSLDVHLLALVQEMLTQAHERLGSSSSRLPE